ncbi:MAG: ribosome silencing factor [Fimbriimonas sp.]|jgi:ribosome-associated protein|nr:ribosome silencing factor [Fimbriimonas sp.]
MTSQETLELIRNAADDMKAERIEVLDVRAKTSIADYFIVCSGTSDRHVDAIADRVSEKLVEHKLKPLRSEGERSGWILQDYGDVVLHVMKEEQRQFYDLESLWQSAQVNTDLV